MRQVAFPGSSFCTFILVLLSVNAVATFCALFHLQLGAESVPFHACTSFLLCFSIYCVQELSLIFSYLPQMTDVQLTRVAKACSMGKGMGRDVTRDE